MLLEKCFGYRTWYYRQILNIRWEPVYYNTVYIYFSDFFMSIAKGHKDSQFWIGMSDLASEQKFIWQDNSPVTFTHWGPREPTSSNPNAKLKVQSIPPKMGAILFNQGYVLVV